MHTCDTVQLSRRRWLKSRKNPQMRPNVPARSVWTKLGMVGSQICLFVATFAFWKHTNSYRLVNILFRLWMCLNVFTSLQVHVWPTEFVMSGIVCHPWRTHLTQALCAAFVGNHGKCCDLCWRNRLTLGAMITHPSVIPYDSCSHGEQRSVVPDCALN